MIALSIFAAEPPPANTTGYMIAGYTVIFTIMLLYGISLAVRSRNLRRNLEMLQELEHAPEQQKRSAVPNQPIEN